MGKTIYVVLKDGRKLLVKLTKQSGAANNLPGRFNKYSY